jgi:hypothetical protein
MEDAFGYVLFGVVAICAVVAVVALAGAGRVYEQIGKGGLSLRDGSDRPPDEPLPGVAAAQRDEEIRQMLQARNERRARRGEPPLDIEAQIAQLTRPAVDPGLALEVRQLVEARNHRRVARGKEPLDVEAEVERQLRELS